MGVLYETVRATKHNRGENKFLFNRDLEMKEQSYPDNNSARTVMNEFQEQKGEMHMEQITEPQMLVRDYASIGSHVKKALEKADQLNANERAVQQLTVHKTEAYGYFDELGKKFGKIAKKTETEDDDRYADALRGKLGAELANINSVSVEDVENAFYELSK